MDKQNTYYLRKLQSEFEARLSRNPRYSLRAFAKSMGMEASSLSAVLRGKRRISKNIVDQIANRLELSPKEYQLFKNSNANLPTQTQSIYELDFELDEEAHFNIIADWEHSAILSLMETKDFKPSLKWMSERLGLTETRVATCVENLKAGGLISVKDGEYSLNQQGSYTSWDIPSKAIKKARKQDLDLIAAAIDEVELELRDLSAATLTLNKKDLPKLKQKIKEFRLNFMNEAEAEPGEEVYKLSVNLLPLTKIKN